MNVEAVATVVACLALIAGFTLAGMSLMKRGVSSKGATGTLGSARSMIDPATGAPTKQEAAAAREEQKQQRHESTESGKDFDRDGVHGGRIVISAAGPRAGHAHQPPPLPDGMTDGPKEAGPAPEVKRTDII
jgi:hypothetical protein